MIDLNGHDRAYDVSAALQVLLQFCNDRFFCLLVHIWIALASEQDDAHLVKLRLLKRGGCKNIVLAGGKGENIMECNVASGVAASECEGTGNVLRVVGCQFRFKYLIIV